MHDTMLLDKISNSLGELCRSHNIIRIKKLSLIVDNNSHINSSNLYEHMQDSNKGLIGEWTKIEVEKEALDNQVAIIHSIEGDVPEK